MLLRPSRRVRDMAQRFARADRGATAVEFALISIPMMMLIFGVMELALVFLASTTLESATENAGRRIRTGEFQDSGAASQADFKTLVCGSMTWLSADCGADLFVDVQTFSSFNTLANAPARDPATFDLTGGCWSPGQPTDIVLVRTYYRWKLFTPLVDDALQNMGGGSGKRLLSATTAFRNEPYNDNPPVGAAC